MSTDESTHPSPIDGAHADPSRVSGRRRTNQYAPPWTHAVELRDVAPGDVVRVLRLMLGLPPD
ncbi:MAG: hypothetical protein KDK70_16400, partial [Myxococcales bacterium]|nr:hypothetical protein [Myxococcales bacterium]